MLKIDPREAELIKAHVLKKPREWVLAHPDAKVHSYKVIKLIKLREKGVPLAYLTGKKEFFGLEFFVNKNVLIPRPETELMVELVLNHLKTKTYNLKPILIDMGTGSGCIPITIAKNLEILKFRNLEIIAIDISKQTLTITQKNIKKHQVKIKLLHGNLLEPFLKKSKITKLQNYKIFITANLPYLTPQQYCEEKSIHHEPRLALVAGPDGLKYYRTLLKQISQNLFLIPYSLFLEIDPSQTSSIKLLIKKYLHQLALSDSRREAKITMHKDLNGKNRMVEIEVDKYLKK